MNTTYQGHYSIQVMCQWQPAKNYTPPWGSVSGISRSGRLHLYQQCDPPFFYFYHTVFYSLANTSISFLYQVPSNNQQEQEYTTLEFSL